MPGTSRLVPPGIVCTSAGAGRATLLRLAATSAVLGIHLASAPAATATTAPMPAILKNCRLVAAFEAAVAGRAIGCAAPDEPALGFSAVDPVNGGVVTAVCVSFSGSVS